MDATSYETMDEARRNGARWRVEYAGFIGPVVRYFLTRTLCVYWARCVGKFDVARISRIPSPTPRAPVGGVS